MVKFLFVIVFLVGASVQDNIDTTDCNEYLYKAIKSGRVDVVTFLIDNGANVISFKQHQFTPLQFAVAQGQTEIFKILFELGVDNVYIYKITLLHIATIFDHLEICKILIANGTNVNAEDFQKFTPLHTAALYGSNDTVEYLIARGANITAEDDYKFTPLHMAAMIGNLNSCKSLIAHGADINARTEKNQTCLHLAAILGNKELVEYLIKQGANVNATARDGERFMYTPLHVAYSYDNAEVQRVLIDNGADENAKDENNKTPREMDTEEGKMEKPKIIEYMNIKKKMFEDV